MHERTDAPALVTPAAQRCLKPLYRWILWPMMGRSGPLGPYQRQANHTLTRSAFTSASAAEAVR